jgi:ketopantoate hydroxymethyltransferase
MKGGEIMKKTMKKTLASLALALISLPTFGLQANAQAATDDLFGGTAQMTAVQTNTFGGNSDPRTIAAQIINVIMGFLGLVAVVIILLGGFKWMTAAGAEDKIDEAKKLLSAGVIGLVIVLSSWAIAKFVLDSVIGVTSV